MLGVRPEASTVPGAAGAGEADAAPGAAFAALPLSTGLPQPAQNAAPSASAAPQFAQKAIGVPPSCVSGHRLLQCNVPVTRTRLQKSGTTSQRPHVTPLAVTEQHVSKIYAPTHPEEGMGAPDPHAVTSVTCRRVTNASSINRYAPQSAP